MTVLSDKPRTRRAVPARPRNRLVTALVGGFAALVVLDLVITGIGSPPGNVPAVKLGENTGVPMVPTNADFPYNHTHTIWAIVLLGGLGTIGFAVAIRDAIRNRDYLPLFIGLGTIAVVFPEVFFDIVGMVYYPVHSGDFAFKIFGRRMGWFIVGGWFGAGAFAGLMLKALRSRPKAWQVWALVLGVGISYSIFEEILVTAGGMYQYYGNQPMWWHSLPLWWTPCNVIGCALLPAAFAYRYQHILTGWRAAVMVIVVPVSVAGTYAFIAMPSWIVVNADYPWLPTELGGLATYALGIGMIAVVLNAFMGYQPFDPDSGPAGSNTRE
ncbi:MAG TPA: hypothetical protein VGJ14_10370 [Sporichthyaceae bacterium]|jgi:hypothetical protein